MNSQVSGKFYHYHLDTPYGWDTEEYRVFPVDTPESEIVCDWHTAVSDYAASVYSSFEDSFSIDEGDDLEQFVADSYDYSYMKQISAEEYFAENPDRASAPTS